MSIKTLVFTALLCGYPFSAFSEATPIERVVVDLTNARKGVLHAELSIPVRPGRLTLVYPEWIPGDHAPAGPIGNLAGLNMAANGRSLEWWRDKVDLYAFHVDVPQGASTVVVKLDFLAVASTAGATLNASVATTEKLADLRWPLVILYPENANIHQLICEPILKLPEGWHYATALKTVSEDGATVRFAPASLARLLDSPVIAGQYFRRFAIAPGIKPPTFMDIVADAPEDLATTPKQEEDLSNMVREAAVLFGSHYFEHYDFLVTLSNKMMPQKTAIGGQEHHESSDDIGAEKVFRDAVGVLSVGSTLAHEYAHTWNGKYRRPIGEVNANYQVPMENDLLWVYEGLTTYLGQVLAVRSGAWTAEQFREAIANEAASMDYEPGRRWKDLEDTGVSLPTLMNAPPGWSSWRRGADYYPEGSLLWLDVDATIRTLTRGRKSLDDFCRLFFGPSGDHAPLVLPYTFEDVVKVLNSVAANDWVSFLKLRLRSKSEHAPFGGITQAGWTLNYESAPNQFELLSEIDTGTLNAFYSIGLKVKQNGSLVDVRWGSPADIAGVGPDMKIVGVEGRQFSLAGLKAAIEGAKDSLKPIMLSISNTGYERRIEIQWNGGERYPVLERQSGSPDLLTDISKPLAISAQR